MQEFQNVIIPYQPKSVFPSEMFFFYVLAKKFECDHILETGGRIGGSTSYLSQLFDRVDSVSEKSNESLPNVQKHHGDGSKLIPNLVRESGSSSIAVLIDGPKGQAAIDLALRLIEDERVKFVAVHDLTEEQTGERFSSKNDEIREAIGHLDVGTGDYLLKYPKGPGLTIFTNEPI